MKKTIILFFAAFISLSSFAQSKEKKDTTIQITVSLDQYRALLYAIDQNIANGGTGATTAAAAFNALSPMTTAGDIIYGGTAGAGTRLAAGTNVTITTGYALLAVGNIGASGFFNTSDLSTKNVITRTPGIGFDNITYTWKDHRDNDLHYGYGAQDVQKVLPGAVKMGVDNKLSVNYAEANAYKIMMLEKKILDLESQIDHIKNKQSWVGQV